MNRLRARLPLSFAIAPLIGSFLVATNALASAESFTIVDHDDLNIFVAASPCTPPLVFTGRLHQVEHTTIAGDGNQNVDLHQELFGTLTQPDTGQTYVLASTDEHHFTNAAGPQIENGFTVDVHVQSTGSAPNFLLHENFHFTINANGQPEAVVDNMNVECTG